MSCENDGGNRRDCVMCGKGFSTTFTAQRYCSHECKSMKRWTCATCGVEQVSPRRKKYCSQDCIRKQTYTKRSVTLRTCCWCGKDYQGVGRAAYCSDECRRAQMQGQTFDHDPGGANRQGTSNEMLVISELLRQGYQVYRPVAGDAPFDLILWDGETLTKAEVKTTRYLARGGLRSRKVNDCVDCVFYVTNVDRQIHKRTRTPSGDAAVSQVP